jgi:signal transduction histidine kinase
VETLAAAADRVTAGDFAAPLGRSSVREVRRVARAFDQMRAALAARLRELETANRELATRQERLGALQAELVQRERMATAGRLLGYLAHEVRNPVANVRNCLELVRRRVVGDEEAREFVDMAIDELRRMHGLAEQMLDLNRPRDPREHDCDAATVARDVAALERVGVAGERVTIEVTGGAPLPAAIPPDALKQVLVNLVQNAREALGGDGRIELRLSREGARAVVEVLDDGPGLASDTVDRVFDPFFTTKGGVEGVGLGLYIADRIVRASGGRITARNRPEGPGACFRIELWAPDARPVAPARAAPTPTHTGAPAHGTR